MPLLSFLVLSFFLLLRVWFNKKDLFVDGGDSPTKINFRVQKMSEPGWVSGKAICAQPSLRGQLKKEEGKRGWRNYSLTPQLEYWLGRSTDTPAARLASLYFPLRYILTSLDVHARRAPLVSIGRIFRCTGSIEYSDSSGIFFVLLTISGTSLEARKLQSDIPSHLKNEVTGKPSWSSPSSSGRDIG